MLVLQYGVTGSIPRSSSLSIETEPSSHDSFQGQTADNDIL